MDKQQYLDTLTEIGTCEDETRRRDLLASLHTESATLFDNNAALTTANKNLTTDNENLRSANMKLFLQVGSRKTDGQRKEDTTGVKEQPESKLKYEDLFNENGGLK